MGLWWQLTEEMDMKTFRKNVVVYNQALDDITVQIAL